MIDYFPSDWIMPSAFDFANLPECKYEPPKVKLRQVEPEQYFYFLYGEEAYIVRYGYEYGWGLGFVQPSLVKAFIAYATAKGAKKVWLEGQPYDDELVPLYSKPQDFRHDRRGARDLDERAFLRKYLPGIFTQAGEPDV